MENRAAVGLEIEFQQYKNKSKRRETELLEALEEKSKQINKLERSVQTLTNEMVNNSKEKVQQISRNLDDSDSSCTKCKDLNRLIISQKEVHRSCEIVLSVNQSLHLNWQSAKLKLDSLETENDSLKKDIEHLTSLHGTVKDVQNQIVSLQTEKCKLGSVKEQFEIISKETAYKTEEKIKISLEIQTLDAHRQTLETQCEKLTSDIAANSCVREELDKQRNENDSLHSELQKIKTQVKNVQLKCNDLMTENESKSETLEKLNMEILTARKQLQILQNEYSDIQQKYEQIQAKCNKHEGTIGEIQTDYDSIQNKYQRLQKEYEKLENDSVQSLENCDRVKDQNKNLETEMRDLKIKVEEAQRKLLENHNLQREQHRLQEEQGRNSSMSPCREKNNDDLHQENCKLKEELRNLTTQFNEIQKEYKEMSTELTDTLSDSETLQNEIKKLQEEIERYKISTEGRPLEKDFQSLKEKLESENSKLLTENLQWKETVDTVKKYIEEKEQRLARLEERMKSDSPVKSIENCAQFMQLSNSFIEIEIALGNGNTRIFQTTETHRSTNGTRMIVGNVSNLTKGIFSELRGTIEFAISNEVHKFGSDMFDSLEMEKSTSSPNSCDSLERHPNEIQINDLTEEKSRLIEKVRDLQDTVAVLQAENATLLNTQLELAKTQLTIQQLNCEKDDLSAACENSKSKIIELNKIIHRTKYNNKSFTADCEQPKRAVESGCTLEPYEELKQQHVEMCEKLRLSDKICADLIEEILALQKAKREEKTTPNSLKIEAMNSSNVKEVTENNNGIYLENNNTGNFSQLREEDLLPSGAQISKYDEEIYRLVERLQQQESNSLKLNEQVIELKISLDKKTKESFENAHKIEELTRSSEKLKAEYDELLSFERMKSTELEETVLNLKKLENECSLLENSVANLKKTVTSLEVELKDSLQDKEVLLENNKKLKEELNVIEQQTIKLEGDKKEITAQCQCLEDSKQRLHGELENMKHDYETIVKDKNQLENNYQTLSDELDRLKKATSETLDENFNKLINELIAMKTEKEDLIAELKIQQEKHLEEKSVLKEKCTSLIKEIADLTSNMSDIQLALEKEQKHSESILQEGKNKEAQLNLELCEARNSGINMSQQIEMLNDKFKKELLRVAFEEAIFEKEELITELTNQDTVLRSQISELTEKCKTLEQKLEEIKRDDLIVQLTNNNNSRVTLSAELKDKLAILGNQHEESERHLSGENKLLNKAKEENNLQSSKVENLTYKIKSLEGDLNIAQSQASERDSLLKKLDKLQIEYDPLALKYTNLEEVRASFEAELNSTRPAVVENASLVGKVNALLSYLQEIQLKCDSLTSSNTDLKFKNMALTLKMNNLPVKALKYILSVGEFRSLREELKKSQTKLAQKESNVTKITDLESYINRLLSEKANIQRAEKNHLNKIALLEDQIHLLSKDRSISLPKSTISPKRETGMEHMMSENHQSKIKNMCLMDKLDSKNLSTNEERKNRRLSTHDEGRLQSFWDINRDVSTMTDPASADCSCSEMDKKLNEMKRKLLIRYSQVTILSMKLKTKNANLKRLNIEEESKQQHLRQEIKEYKNLVVNRTNENHCAKCAEVAKKIFVDSFVQTTEIDESECYRVLPRKYEDLKIIELQDALSKGKENANNDKISSFNHQQYKVGKVVAVVIISLFLYLKR